MRFLELADSSRQRAGRQSPQDGERGMRSQCLLGTEFQLGKDEKVLEKDGGDASITM